MKPAITAPASKRLTAAERATASVYLPMASEPSRAAGRNGKAAAPRNGAAAKSGNSAVDRAGKAITNGAAKSVGNGPAKASRSAVAAVPAISANLASLLAKLDAFERAIPLDTLVQIVKAAPLTIEDLRPFRQFGEHCYQRNSIRIGPAYQALLLCWASGQRSPIHDHNGSACCVRVMEGRATEVIFDRAACGLISPTETHTRETGEVCGSFDADMHQMGNLEAPPSMLCSLHIYSPPLLAMRTFHLGDAIHGEFEDRESGAKVEQALAMRAAKKRGRGKAR